MNGKRLKVGYVAIIQLNFRGNKQAVYDRTVLDLPPLAQKNGFDLVLYPELVVTEAQARDVNDFMKREAVDLLLVQSASFASGYLIQTLAKAAPAIALWAVEEESQAGYLPQNSFCAMNLNGSIMREYMSRDNKYKWLFGPVDSPLFQERLMVTVQALGAIKAAQGSVILHIGGTANGFSNFYYDERKLLTRLGVRVTEVEYGDLKAKAEGYDEKTLQPLMDEIAAATPCLSQLAKEKLLPHARVYRAIRDMMDETGAAATAMSCWPRFRVDWGFTPCATFGLLNQNGYIISCEGDVLSAVSMLLLREISGGEPILMDLVAFDQQDDTMQLWHCGVGSKTFAKGGCVTLDTHYNPGPYRPETGWASAGPVAVMEFEKAPLTCMRLTRDCDSMLTFSGSIVDKSPVYHGSGGWLGKMTMDETPIKALDMVNTIMAYGFQHHYPLVHGSYEDACRELAAWLEIAPLEKVPYKKYMQMK